MAFLSTVWTSFVKEVERNLGKVLDGELVASLGHEIGTSEYLQDFHLTLQSIWESFANPYLPKNLARGMSGLGSPSRHKTTRKLSIGGGGAESAVKFAAEFDELLPHGDDLMGRATAEISF
jgi:hypothetical protein